MKSEEFRRSTPSDDRTPLPKGETKPCMRGVLDLELYNRTGEVKMIEPLKEYVSPMDPMAATPINPHVRRKGNFTMNPNKPKKDALEKDLRSGLPILNIAKKYGASVASIHNWIKSYGLAGIRGVKKPKDNVATDIPETSDIPDMVQTSPALEEIEQFHTDDPVQVLPKVEMDPVVNIPSGEQKGIPETLKDNGIDRVPGCFSEYNPQVYWCNDCKDKAECLTTFNKLKLEQTNEKQPLPKVEMDPVGMTEEENMTDEEWEGKDSAPPAPTEPFEEVWQGIRDDILSQKRVYVAEAEKSFNERLRGLFLEVMG